MVRYLSITTHNIMVVSEYEYADLQSLDTCSHNFIFFKLKQADRGCAAGAFFCWGGRGRLGKKVCNAPRATDFREERNPQQADSIVSVLIDSKLCTIQYCNITILLQYCTIL